MQCITLNIRKHLWETSQNMTAVHLQNESEIWLWNSISNVSTSRVQSTTKWTPCIIVAITLKKWLHVPTAIMWITEQIAFLSNKNISAHWFKFRHAEKIIKQNTWWFCSQTTYCVSCFCIYFSGFNDHVQVHGSCLVKPVLVQNALIIAKWSSISNIFYIMMQLHFPKTLAGLACAIAMLRFCDGCKEVARVCLIT